MKRTNWKTMLAGLFALIFIWTFIGCAAQSKAVYIVSPAAPATEAESEPTVQSNIQALKKPMQAAPKSPAAPATEAESKPTVQSNIQALKKPMQAAPKSPAAPATDAKSKPTVQSNIQVLNKPVPLEQGAEFYVHMVRWTGETLSVIAKWYTGYQSNWEHIVRVNPGLDPMRMKIGDKIFIPLALLKTRESMPQKFQGTVGRKKDAPSTPLVKPAIEPDREGFAGTSKTDRLEAKVDKIKLYQPKDTELSAEKSDEIELFQPQNIEQIAAESGEVELFQPIE